MKNIFRNKKKNKETKKEFNLIKVWELAFKSKKYKKEIYNHIFSGDCESILIKGEYIMLRKSRMAPYTYWLRYGYITQHISRDNYIILQNMFHGCSEKEREEKEKRERREKYLKEEESDNEIRIENEIFLRKEFKL